MSYSPISRRTGVPSTILLIGGLGFLAWTLHTPPVTSTPNSDTNTHSTDPGQQMFSLSQIAPGQTPNAHTAVPGLKPALPLPNAPAAGLQQDPRLLALWQKALTAQQQNKLEEAATAYRELLRAKPDAFPAHVNLGVLLLQQNKSTQALWHLKRAAALAPKETRPRLLLAQTYGSLKRPRDAFEQWAELATMSQGQSVAKPLYIQATMAAGELAFTQLKDLASAEKWLRRANGALEGREPRVALMLGQALGARNKHRDAVKVLTATAKYYPHTMEILSALADQQWQSGDAKQALVTLRSLEKNTSPTLNNGENLGQVRVLMGRALAEQKQFAQAVDVVKNALSVLSKTSPSQKSTQQLLAQMLAAKAGDEEKRGKLTDSAKTWGEATSLFPDNPFAYAQRGRVLEKQGEDRDALQQYQRALKLAPKEPNFLLRSAILEEKTGDDASALSLWKKLIESQPDFAPAYFNLARVGAKTQQLPTQMKYLETRIDGNPNQRAPYDAVLEMGARSGQNDLVRDWVEALAKKYPKASAPRNALIAFDREHPNSKPSKTPTPIVPDATPTPTSTPAADSLQPKPTTSPTNVPFTRATPRVTAPNVDANAPSTDEAMH